MLNLSAGQIEIKSIFVSLELKNEKAAEDYLKNCYLELGYQVFKTVSLKTQLQENKVKLPFNYQQNIKKILLFEDIVGLPDLTIFNEREIFFVEVKTRDGTLNTSQLYWISQHTETKIIIILVDSLFNSTSVNYVPPSIQTLANTSEVFKFLNLITEVTKRKDDYITKRKLYLMYTKYCADNNLTPLTEILFGREIKKHSGITSKRYTNKLLSQRRGKQVQEECWIGIKNVLPHYL